MLNGRQLDGPGRSSPREATDVLIVGGGVIGMACAHYLAQAGRTVRLIEQERIGAGASHGNCGLVVVSYLLPMCAPGVVQKELFGLLRRSSPLYVKPALDVGLLIWLLRFAGMCREGHLRHAIPARSALLGSSDRLFQELFRDHGLDGEYERQGVLIVCRTEAAMQAYEAKNERLRPFGHAADPLVGNALQAVEPALREDVFGAWHHRTDSHLRPDRLLQSWKHVLTRSGVTIEEDCRLTGFRREGDHIAAVVTNRGEFQAREVVLAAGAWSAPVAAQLKLRLPLQPGKGYSMTMTRPAVCPRIPCSFSERRVVVTPWPSGYRLGGTMEFSGFAALPDPRRFAALTAAAADYLREPAGRLVVEEWTGLRPMTFDDLPLIGPAPGVRNLWVATGHGMLGITAAPATGKLVQELICGQAPHIDPLPFRVGRHAQ
jgi:D-amino-acid dehydrogenase